jgi:hypothetical protein
MTRVYALVLLKKDVGLQKSTAVFERNNGANEK